MGWRVVYIEEGTNLSLYLDNVKVSRKAKDDILIPLQDIHSIIIDNYKLVLTVQLMNRCMHHNINIVTCGIDHLPEAIVLPQSGHYAQAKVIRNQVLWDTERKALLHQKIVQQKINNQIQACVICNVDKGLLNFQKLTNYMNQVEIGDKTNREGLAAKVYFSLIFGSTFTRFDDDSVNGALNYGYAILRSQMTKTIVSKGLHPALGIFHKGPENAFNLSDDIIEVFRPLVDVWVHKNIDNSKELTRQDRTSLIKLTTGKVMIDGKKQTQFNATSRYLDTIIDFMEYKSDNLSFPYIDIY